MRARHFTLLRLIKCRKRKESGSRPTSHVHTAVEHGRIIINRQVRARVRTNYRSLVVECTVFPFSRLPAPRDFDFAKIYRTGELLFFFPVGRVGVCALSMVVCTNALCADAFICRLQYIQVGSLLKCYK